MGLRMAEREVRDIVFAMQRKNQKNFESTQSVLDKLGIKKKCEKPKKRNKYNANRVIVDGFPFHSKVEADYYCKLVEMKKAGEIKTFFMQVPIFLGNRNKYVVDFMIVLNDNTVRYADVKGYATEIFKLKKNIAETVHGIEIDVIYIRKPREKKCKF